MMIEILKTLDFDNLINVLPWLIPFGVVLVLNEWLDKKNKLAQRNS
jgi:hypothetical protein